MRLFWKENNLVRWIQIFETVLEGKNLVRWIQICEIVLEREKSCKMDPDL